MSYNNTIRQAFNDTGSLEVGLSLAASIISVMAVTCNALLICVIVKSRLHQTPTNMFIASLAVGEIMIGIFGIPFAAASVVVNRWPFTDAVCRMSGMFHTVGRSSSTYSLMAVCIDRCLAVSRPLKYTHILTLKSSTVMLVFIWILGFIVGLLPLDAWGAYKYASEYYMCILFKENGGHQHIVKEVICSYIPAVVIICSLLMIVKEVKSHHRIFAVVPLPVTSSTGGGEIISGLFPGPRGFNRNTSKALRSLFVVTFGYALFCLPASVMYLVYQHRHPTTTSGAVVTSVVWLSFLCCVINPLIIIVFNRKFRGQMKAIFSMRSCLSARPGKEIFTISSGLHNVLDATLVLNMVKHEHASTTASTRRQIFRLSAAP